MKYELWRGTDRGLCGRGCGRQDHQLNTYDWLADVPGNNATTDLVEVQFKNTRKGYYHNVNNLDLKKGDIVAVEANPGHDIGVVTLTGQLVRLQIKKANIKSPEDIRRIYRIAKEADMEKYAAAKAREHATMIQSREIAKGLGLKMKIGDVEYQGDGNKAIFYYIADERVDFRQLIKDLAAAFHVRIEMKQIGARQEAGRIGGTGPCGRELCCATWVRNFSSVSTNAARFQGVSLNPTKLAGMCAKLKCCLNYEVDDYMEAARRLPSREVSLFTLDAEYFLVKTDILSGECTYSTDRKKMANVETISARRAREIIELNRQGEKPLSLLDDGSVKPEAKSADLLADGDLSRFDKFQKKKKKKKDEKTDYSKEFSTEERLLASLLTDQINLTTNLQKRLDHMLDTKSTAMGVSKYMTDFIEGLNQARSLSMQIIDKKVSIKKTVADLNMKERKEFGKKEDDASKDMSAYSASVLRQIMGDRQTYVNQGTMPLADNAQVSYEDINQFPDIDNMMIDATGDNPDDESNAYLKYENSGVTIRVVYRGKNGDMMDYDFIAEDRDGNVLDDYPLPIKTPLSINNSTGFATDSYGQKYHIDFE